MLKWLLEIFKKKKNGKKMPGAGFILYKYFEDGPKVLALIPPREYQEKSKGLYDIPKGKIDPGESPRECAFRESWEEAGIKISNNMILGGPLEIDELHIWIAQVFSDPVIRPNPVTGIIEHDDWQWLPKEEMALNCFGYLKPFIEWSITVIE